MLKRSMIITRKEWRELFRSRMIKISFVVPAVIFGVVVPLLFSVLGAFIGTVQPSSSGFMPPSDFFPDLSFGQRSYLFFLYAFVSSMFLLLPALLPSYMAADSFAGEKERRTIHQLLSTPLTDSEILLGKMLTALIPAIVTAYACFASTTIIINTSWLLTYNEFRLVYPNLTVLIQLLFLYPLLAFLGTLAMVWVSTKVNKVMEANQYGTLIVVPVLVIAFLPLVSLTLMGAEMALSVSGIIALADYGLFRVASRRFTREAILARL